jgi:hypothetical protein
MKGMRMLVLAAICAGGGGFSEAAAQSSAPCFKPLTNFAGRNPLDFKDLSELGHPAKGGEGVIEFQPIKDGWLKANIDFYYVTFTKPANISPKDFFRDIRLSFGAFARGEKSKFNFAPYGGQYTIFDFGEEGKWYRFRLGSTPSTRISDANSKIWVKDTAETKGAVMSFNLGTAWPSTNRQAGQTNWIVEKAGDVEVICASDTDFVFSTVRTASGGWHPVSGHRGFGLMTDPANPNQWIFYSMAADRRSGAFKNFLLPPHINKLFCMGHEFWKGFFSEFRGFVTKRGLKVTGGSLDNHGPVPFPFEAGNEKALDCAKLWDLEMKYPYAPYLIAS